jgi:thiol-disulfide isomerase/thioredoxin
VTRLAVLALAVACCWAQADRKPAPSASGEEQELAKALEDAGGSSADYLRAIEKHLQKYPESPRRPELERAAALAAIDAKNDAAIVRFGERVLARQPSDLQVLPPVTRALLAEGSKDAAARAMDYARRYEALVRAMQNERRHDADWRNQTDLAIGRALTYQARAAVALGNTAAALALAERAFATYPDAEAARAVASCEEGLGNTAGAARAMADAFTVPDPHNTDADRERDRARMGELYRKAHGSEAGLGDEVLAAYDRNLALVHARELRLRADDPNAQLTDPMEFTLSALDGGKLQMASLKGKVVILDIWATWCVPCRAQHPLYEQVRQRFAGNADVVFLSIDMDEDHAAVRPFLDRVKWQDRVYFEDGLARALKIASIPATIVIGRDGRIFSRMDGYVAETFVDSLAAKVRDALAGGR